MNPLRTALRGAAVITGVMATGLTVLGAGIYIAEHGYVIAFPLSVLVAVFVSLFVIIYAMEKQ